MEKQIVDPNGPDRRGYIIVGAALFGLVVLHGLAVPPTVLVLIAFELLCVTVLMTFLLISRPFAVLGQDGVSVRFFFRNQFFTWCEVEQVGIRDTKATKVSNEYRFPVVIVLPSKSKWHPLWRGIFQSVVVPSRPEIKSFVQTHYGPLDFNDIEKLNDWEKKYYHFD